MLTGAISVTSGEATVKGHSIVTEIDKVRALLGYCPQFDALDPLLTPREHLNFYAKIRNIPSAEVQRVIY
jgi:ABC-type multidrug transport system ATPase subunit